MANTLMSAMTSLWGEARPLDLQGDRAHRRLERVGGPTVYRGGDPASSRRPGATQGVGCFDEDALVDVAGPQRRVGHRQRLVERQLECAVEHGAQRTRDAGRALARGEVPVGDHRAAPLLASHCAVAGDRQPRARRWSQDGPAVGQGSAEV